MGVYGLIIIIFDCVLPIFPYSEARSKSPSKLFRLVGRPGRALQDILQQLSFYIYFIFLICFEHEGG